MPFRSGNVRRRSWAWIALGALLVIAALVQVSFTSPRVHVRWRADVSAPARAELERRYGLTDGIPIDGTTGWRYQLGDRSRENIGAIVRDRAVEDTAYIDRDLLTAEGPRLAVSLRRLPFSGDDDDEDVGYPRLRLLSQLHQSLWLLLAGGMLLWASRAPGVSRRRNATVAVLFLVCALSWMLPISPAFVRMGDARFARMVPRPHQGVNEVSKILAIGSVAALVMTLVAPVSLRAAETKDVVDTAVAAGSFKTLAKALAAADLVSTLKGPGPFTVFAPTDEAFAKLPAATLASLLKPENKAQLRRILTYHVVAGRVMAADVVKMHSAKAVSGDTITVAAGGGGVTVDGARVAKTDIVASNGVIHVIDAVIMPKSK